MVSIRHKSGRKNRSAYLPTHEAPLEQVERYVDDLALWGCNALSVWFDVHHVTGSRKDDPAAV